MTTTNIENNVRRLYQTPAIDKIRLDNEISLVLESTPEGGPDEVLNNTPSYFNNDPFKNNVG